MAADPRNQDNRALTPKQMAARARAETEAAERRRERTIRVVGSIVVLAVVAAILAIGFLSRGDGDPSATPGPTPDPGAALPAGVDATTFGVPYGIGWASERSDTLPTLEIWEDFQCPACAQVEAVAGDQIKALADDGLVKLLFRPAIFLDRNPASLNSSARATSAWGCAIDAGKAGEYHSGVFAIQPAQEGDGFTDQQLKDLGADVGIQGEDLTAFQTCVDQGTYLGWAANSQQEFERSGAGGTPTGFLNGVQLNSGELADVEGLKAKIAAATAK